MWAHEMDAIQKTAYGFVKLTKEDFAKLGIKRTTEQKPDKSEGKKND